MSPEKLPHLFLSGRASAQPFTSPVSGGPKPKLKPRDRAEHAKRIRDQLQQSLDDDASRRLASHSERNCLYLTFASEPGLDLACKSLEVRRLGIRLLNVHDGEAAPVEAQRFATVSIPLKSAGHFFKKIAQYEKENIKDTSKPKNANLVESISEIRRAILETGFWTDRPERIPNKDPDWVEVWLSSTGAPAVPAFLELCVRLHIEAADGSLRFPEREVFLIRANRSQLEQLLEYSDHIAEFRAAREVAAFFLDQDNQDQAQWVDDLVKRTRLANESNVAVLILDHGVNHGHRLLSPILDPNDKYAVIPSWGTHDHDGHGTLMAGTVGYGNLSDHLQSTAAVTIRHRLESAKILPPPAQGQTPKKLWGLYTAQGISFAEIASPDRKRIVCMAVSSQDMGDLGRPSSWSAEVDTLCSGASDEIHRLVLLSAGNVRDAQDYRNYPASNQTREVQDPGQAWNAVTVGAYTSLTKVDANSWPGHEAVAPRGGLSPYSSTSLNWQGGGWPIKPEILFEGGNVAKGPNNGIVAPDSMQLLSTYFDPQKAQFDSFNATSAACALAAHMAAQLQAEYPNAWPETIRGLMVHAAEWTETQLDQFLQDDKKSSYRKLTRICGYGVPDMDRALYCARNSLTLITSTLLNHQPRFSQAFCCVFGRVRGLVFAWHVVA